jgi:hypothetical protein
MRRIDRFIFPGRPFGAPNVGDHRDHTSWVAQHMARLAGDHARALREVAEMQLAHDIGDATEMAYRGKRVLAHRREALTRYGDWQAGVDAVAIPFARAAG